MAQPHFPVKMVALLLYDKRVNQNPDMFVFSFTFGLWSTPWEYTIFFDRETLKTNIIALLHFRFDFEEEQLFDESNNQRLNNLQVIKWNRKISSYPLSD